MARSVIQTKTPRCPRCSLVPRWCICAAEQTCAIPFGLDLLVHRRESHRPTSTGRLIKRIIPETRVHDFAAECPPTRDAVVRSGHEIWIMHPRGESIRPGEHPANLQVLLLDGNWRESTRMAQTAATWGRLVSLPAQSPSRYRLRKQRDQEGYSTAEALIVLLGLMNCPTEQSVLQTQFELHVYAGLRARGAIPEADAFLASSPLVSVMPEFLDTLQTRRPDRG